MAAPLSRVKQVTLKILVDVKKNEVVYAEAGKDFVDVLLSFLTFPLGNIVRIVSNDSNMEKVSVGCLSSLYQSVANLEVKHFWSDTCKEMFLNPRNSSEDYCRNIKLNIDDTEKTRYFICQDLECSRKESGVLLSIFKNKRCKCGKLMDREILRKNTSLLNVEGFVHDSSTFTIFDDLKVIPDNVLRSVSEVSRMEDVNSIKILTVSVTQKEIVDLLKISLLSNTPLTDFFLRRKVFCQNMPQCRSIVAFNNVKAVPSPGERFIVLKVVRRKSNNKILFALAEDDFIDILLSFLTFPLGRVENMLKGNSCLGSIDNLYNSIVGLDSYRYLKSPDLKDMLVKSRLAQHFKLLNQIFPIDEVPIVNYYCYKGHSSIYSSTTYNSSSRESGFVKKPSLYIVTDDLVVKPGSSMSVLSFLTALGFSSSEVDEQIIKIGKTECLSLLKVSLISSSALTDVFG
ncbi:hypothetical protein Lalb_Chr03g0042911 [Lupinus albus]|uniref:DUF674 family protein n=1 Tax=Lupinus albus TaxID=3870 RepID=A0A6A4QWB1_LUPAL|nr:hypothetical protein Lalb_Chr03g0042911 [Lupinus albus]